MTDTDSVTLLREQIGMNVHNLTSRQCAEIADEIERLRKVERFCAIAIEQAVKAEQERCANIVSDAENDAYADDEWDAHERLRNARLDIEGRVSVWPP